MKSIEISYVPLSSGRFLSQVISCSPSFLGNENFKTLETLYKKDVQFWHLYEKTGVQEQIFAETSSSFSFSYYANVKNLICISLEDNNDLNRLRWRQSFINTTSMENSADIQIKYHVELINYLEKNNKDFYKLKLDNMFVQDLFVHEIVEILKKFNCDKIDESLLKDLHKLYLKTNIKFSKSIDKIDKNRGIHFYKDEFFKKEY